MLLQIMEGSQYIPFQSTVGREDPLTSKTPESTCEWLSAARNTITKAIEQGKGVLIHCRAGAHRAGTLIVSYTAAAVGINPRKIVHEIKK